MIRELLARFKCDTRGVAAIEFGIVVVPLLLFMFATTYQLWYEQA